MQWRAVPLARPAVLSERVDRAVPKRDLAAFRHVDTPDLLVVHASGEFDVANAGFLQDTLRAAARAGKDVVLDLRGVTFMDVVSYELVMAARSNIRAAGHSLTLANTPTNVQRIVDVVDREIRRNLPAPRAAFDRGAGAGDTPGIASGA